MDRQIGQKIREVRQRKGVSQEDMAGKLHLSQSGYAKLERGESKLDVERIVEISKVLEVDFFDLMPLESQNVILSHNEIAYGATTQNFYSDMKENYEDRIRHLEDEIQFLREQVRKS